MSVFGKGTVNDKENGASQMGSGWEGNFFLIDRSNRHINQLDISMASF